MLVGRVGPLVTVVRRFCVGKPFENVAFSGIQPTGVLHLGNYFGAVEKWLQLQNDEKFSKIYISVVDLHAVTIYKSPEQLRENIRSMVASLLACGIDPKRTVLFQQSAVPHHALLTWILSAYATVPQLNRLPNFQEKSSKFKDNDSPLALLSYPVLQTADIILYKATHVPVGDDQASHMNFARKLANSFNAKFKTKLFPLPRTLETAHARVKSLRDPSKKMSKSDEDARSRISLDDDAGVIKEKFKKALTDMISQVTYDPEKRPGVSNLINIHSAVSGQTPESIVEEVSHLTTGEYKLYVAERVNEKFSPIREKLKQFYDQPEFLKEILSSGNAEALKVAEKTLTEVKNIIGLSF